MSVRNGWQTFVTIFQSSRLRLGKPEIKASNIQQFRPEFTLKEMFTAACYQFVKSIGKTTLHATPSLDEKDNVKMFQLVVKTKRRSFIFWEKSDFRPTEFQLTDVMMVQKPLGISTQQTDLVSEFNRTSKVSLKGKIGAEISKEILDVELEAKDTLTLDIKFGKVKKVEIREQELIDSLTNRSINMDHPYIQQIRSDKSKVLCIITGVASLPDGGTIHRVTDADIEATSKVKVFKDISGSTGAEYLKDRDIGLSCNTAVAYNVHELNVEKRTGQLQLVLAQGHHGGFCDCIGYDEVDAQAVPSGAVDVSHPQIRQLDKDLEQVRNIFAGITSMDDKTRAELNKKLFELMKIPRDLVLLSDLVDETEKGKQLSLTLIDLANKLISPQDVWLYLLTRAGFILDGEDLKPPHQSDPALAMYGELLDAASMLDDEMMDMVSTFPPHCAQPMLTLLAEGMKGREVKDPSVLKAVLSDPTSMKMLLDLEFRLENDVIDAPVELPYTIDEVYWLIFALYGK
ncbi:gasdermin-E-like isoform X2 [Mya arenaria]|uniref:gasdermin-E-like isoform X2 n=1 Tax=Mya arenaria TaxID=6604 RepID=UPI0022E9877F|nr:gasdermin-E-like isoform X2 [Mya arenaria]